MKIYKITRGQLITIWVFGAIGFLVALSNSEYSGFASFISVLIPALLIFYTIGWRASNISNGNQGFTLSRLIPSRKTEKKIAAVVAVLLLIFLSIYGIAYLNDKRDAELKKQQLQQDYSEAILKVDSLREQGRSCAMPLFDKLYKEELRDCNLLKNKIKHDYDFCVSFTTINSPASCLFENDYEKIDCSEETVRERSHSNFRYSSLPQSCRDILNELTKVNKTINEYSLSNP